MPNAKNDVKAIFLEALDIDDPHARSAFLDRACASDPEKRARVDALLEAEGRVGEFLGGAASPTTTLDRSIGQQPGEKIGRYKLLQRLGEGGFGVVFMAEQLEPVRRKVAMKIIKPGMDTKDVIARFEAERQALALMDHPNIARVLDAGTTDDGRPYFVMDLVKGVPINKFCDKNDLSTRERLGLFMPVCQAVQHAHQKGVIHRDLKPANVMVTLHDGKPVAKVIDFGVSKAISQQLTEKTLFTAYGQMVGTPQYMSPEQAEMSGLDIDTRSDVYSLGVLLYELLTGNTPLEGRRLRGVGYAEMQRMICEEEPPKPSTRLSTLGDELTIIAKHRGADPKRLRQTIRGDLDWIVMKSLEKERGRRYETVSSFASDVERFLNDEAVEARPPSATYKLRKLIHRNKGPFAAVLAVSLAVVAGLIGTTTGWISANNAVQEREDALRIAKRAAETARKESKEKERALGFAERAERTALEESQKNRRLLYLSDMHVALQAWEEGNFGRVVALLKRNQPAQGEEDLRGFEWYYLFRLCTRGLLAKTLSVSNSKSVAYSPDGKILAAAASGRSVRLWEIETGQMKTLQIEEAQLLWSIAFSPDSKTLAVTGSFGLVQIWDLETEAKRVSLHGHNPLSQVRCARFSSDGKRLATASKDGTVNLWDRENEELVQTLKHDAGVLTVEFRRDSDMLATGDSDGNIHLWHADSGERIRTLAEHSAAVNSLAFSRNGMLASGSQDETIKLWNVEDGSLIRELKGHTMAVESVAFSPADEQVLASSSSDCTIKLWDISTHRELTSLKGHGNWVKAIGFSPDGRELASTSGDNTLKIWMMDRKSHPYIFEEHSGFIRSVAFSPVRDTLAYADVTGSVRLCDANTGETQVMLTDESKPREVRSLAYSPNGEMVVTGGTKGDATLWDTATGDRPKTLRESAGYHAWSVAFAPAGNAVAWGGRHTTLTPRGPAGRLQFWDSVTGEPLGQLGERHFEVSVRCIAYSPCEDILAVSTMDQTLTLWNVVTLENVGTFPSRGWGDIWSIAFSPDGRKLAATHRIGVIDLWDVETGQCRTLRGHSGSVRSLAFSPTEQILASGSRDESIRLWDVDSGEQRGVLRGHTDLVNSLSFSRDGKILASGSGDRTVRLWRAATNKEVQDCIKHSEVW